MKKQVVDAIGKDVTLERDELKNNLEKCSKNQLINLRILRPAVQEKVCLHPRKVSNSIESIQSHDVSFLHNVQYIEVKNEII